MIKKNKLVTAVIVALLLVQGSVQKLRSQDSLNYFIGIDAFKILVNEPSLTFGTALNKHHLLSVSLGYTYLNPNLRESFKTLSPRQKDYPIFVYNGPVVRLDYSLRFTTGLVGLDGFYKYQYYNNYTFYDSEGDYGDNTFVRSETATVYGWHFHWGFRKDVGSNKVTYISTVFAVGSTVKYRNYKTTDSYGRGGMDRVPLGKYSEVQHYPSFMLSINVGINFRLQPFKMGNLK